MSASLSPLLAGLAELRDTFFLQITGYYKNDRTLEQPAVLKGCRGQGGGKGCRAPLPSPGAPLSPDLHVAH